MINIATNVRVFLKSCLCALLIFVFFLQIRKEINKECTQLKIVVFYHLTSMFDASNESGSRSPTRFIS